MNSAKIIKLIEKEAKRRIQKPLYYRDENNKLWLGQQTAMYRLDEDVILTENWVERNMDGIIAGHKEAVNIIPSKIQIDGFELKSIAGHANCSLFLANDDYRFAQTQYTTEILGKETGYWKYNGYLLYFIDQNDLPKAVIACILNGSINAIYRENFLKLAELMGQPV